MTTFNNFTRTFTFVAALFLIGFHFGLANPAESQSLELLSPSQSTTGDRVGRSVSANNRRFAVGAPLSDVPSADSGAVYMYSVDLLGAHADGRLAASDPSTGSNFGASVSVSGDVVAIGAPLEDRALFTDAGSVYVFRRLTSGWVQESKLTPSTAVSGQKFGYSVALSGNNLFIGAPGDASQRGSVFRYAYVNNTWTFQQQFAPSNPLPGQGFGYSLASDGPWTAIGMLQNAPEGSAPGRVSMLLDMGGSWAEAQVVTAQSGSYDDRFGVSVGLAGSGLVVGAMGLSTQAVNSGGAYVFELQNGVWVQTQLMLPGTPQANRFAGFSVAIVGGTSSTSELMIGAPYADTTRVDAGAAFSFRRLGSSFVPQTTFVGHAEEANDLFGSAVGIARWKNRNYHLIGSPQDNTRGLRSGTAYLSRVFRVLAVAVAEICLPQEC